MSGGGGGYVADMMAPGILQLEFRIPMAQQKAPEASMAESFNGTSGLGRPETTEAMTTLPPQAWRWRSSGSGESSFVLLPGILELITNANRRKWLRTSIILPVQQV